MIEIRVYTVLYMHFLSCSNITYEILVVQTFAALNTNENNTSVCFCKACAVSRLCVSACVHAGERAPHLVVIFDTRNMEQFSDYRTRSKARISKNSY